MPAWPPVDRNDMRRYLWVLAWAYLLETLGEAAYRTGGMGIGQRAERERWELFADTEARMSLLIREELLRLGVRPPLRAAQMTERAARALCGLLGAPLLSSLIRHILGQRRYSRWADEFRPRNAPLWDALLEHERRQVEHFEGAWSLGY